MAGPFETLAGAHNNPMHSLLGGLAEGVLQSNARELVNEIKYRGQLEQQFKAISEDPSYGVVIDPKTGRTAQDLARDYRHAIMFIKPTDKLPNQFKADRKTGQIPALTEVMYHKQMAKGPDAPKQPPEPANPNVGLQAPPTIAEPPMTMTDSGSGMDGSGLMPPPTMGLDETNVSTIADTAAPPPAAPAMAAVPGGVQPMPGKVMPGPAVGMGAGAPPDVGAAGPPPAGPTPVAAPPAASPVDPNDPYAGMVPRRMSLEDQARQTAKLETIKNSRTVFGKAAQVRGVPDGTVIDSRDDKILGQLGGSQMKIEAALRKTGVAGVYDSTSGALIGTRPLANGELSQKEVIHNSYMQAHEGLLDAQTDVAEANAIGKPEEIQIAKGKLAIAQRKAALAEKALAQGVNPFGGIFGGAGAGAAAGSAAGQAQSEVSPDAILGKLSQPDRAQVIAILEGRADPRALSMRSSGKGTLSRRDYILGIAHSVDSTYNEGDWMAMQKTRTNLVSGKDHDNITSINTLIDHLVHFKHNAAALDNSDVRLWNEIANKGISAVGDSRVRKLQSDATAVSNELAAMFKRGMGTDQEIKAWRDNFNLADSPAQLEAAWQEGIQLMIGRASTIIGVRDANLNKWAAAKIPVFIGRSRTLLSKELGVDADQIDSAPAAGMANYKSFSGGAGGLTPPPDMGLGGKKTISAKTYDAMLAAYPKRKADIESRYTRGQ